MNLNTTGEMIIELTYYDIPLKIEGQYWQAQKGGLETEPLRESFEIEFIFDGITDTTGYYSDTEIKILEKLILDHYIK